MSTRSGLRILMYSQDGFGLGHLRRSLNIARELVARRPGSSVLLLSDSQVAPFFELPAGMDFVKLPSIRKVSAGHWESVRVPMDVDEACALRASLILQTALNFAPDVFLIDHMPLGARGELRWTLARVRRECPHTRLVLGLRDILDAPEVTARVWQQDGAYRALDTYDRILIYGARDVFDAPRAYRFPAHALAKVRYCGYVTSDAPLIDAPTLRAELQLSAARLVTVMVGGGADGYPVMQSYLGALAHLHDQEPFQSLIVTGPFMDSAEREQLQARARELPGVCIVAETHHSRSLIAASDALVCMAGYNTLTEVLRARRPALCVPRVGPSAEQRTRALLFKQRGLLHGVVLPHYTAAQMADAVRDLLLRPSAPRDPLPPLDGARRAAEEILSLVEEDECSTPALALAMS